jgi:hypothetical protein
MPRKLSAHYVFPGGSPPLKRGIVVADDSGNILDVIDTNGNLLESQALEFYDGIITPGFLNTDIDKLKFIQQQNPHLHLEELIDRSTLYMAKAMHLEGTMGTIEKGKKPGLNLITGIDFVKMQLTSQSEVKVLM